MATLKAARPRSLTSLAIVDLVYDNIPLAVKFSAQNNVELHLDKLVKDGLVAKRGGTWIALE